MSADHNAQGPGADQPTDAPGNPQADGSSRRTLGVWFAAGVVLALVAIGMNYLLSRDDSGDRQSTTPSEESSTIEGLKSFQVTGNHVLGPLEYDQSPPAGGPHNPFWLNCGIYAEQVPSENIVHSLEHGAVWIAYDPSLPADDLAALEALTPDTFAILSPYDDMDSPIVVSAWANQVAVDSPEDPRISAFIEAHRNSGDAPEVGAPCTGASDGTIPLDTAPGG